MEAAMIAAAFSSFADFSSRIVLLPRHDDEGTGAKVASHDPVELSQDENAPSYDTTLSDEVGGEGASGKDVDDADADVDNDGARELDQRKNEQHSREVPVGYVLVKIIIESDGGNDSGGAPDDVEDIEFADLLSFLRTAPFPMALVFAPPKDIPKSDKVDGKGEGEAEDDDASSTDIISSSGPLDVEEETAENNEGAQSLAALSREDAQKYAKQAATELRGRLSRWGHQAAARAADAATRAADAAAQVKELRDDRQRKVQDEQQTTRDQDEAGGNDSKPEAVVESVAEEKTQQPQDLPVAATVKSEKSGLVSSLPDPCFIYLQTSSGFEQLPDDETAGACPLITNDSVVSVRLSQERACPLGKNGFTFQWYRSDGEEPIWQILRGACHPSYQPNVTDAGHRLRCIIKHEESHQTCHLPCVVRIDQQLFESTTNTLLGGQKSVTFGNLRGAEDHSSCSLKVDVSSDGHFITGSSIFLDVVGGSNEGQPVTQFRGVADPSKPKLLDLVSSIHGRVRLEAANRKSRESMLIALGVANFKGKLSSLTTETSLFHSDEAEIEPESGAEMPEGMSTDSPDNLRSKQPEAKLAEMQRLLESKDIAIAKLQKELVASDAMSRTVQMELVSSRNAKREANDALATCQKALEEKVGAIEEIEKAKADMERVHERTVKALHNDKAVLSSTIEARDGKIEALSNRNAELERRALAQSEELSNVETLKSTLVQSQEKCSTVERVLSKMKETESELQKDLKSAKGIVTDLNAKFLAAKETATKCECDCRKLKLERNSFKSKAEGLSKEMLRLSKSKNNADSEAMESVKMKMDLQKTRQESVNLKQESETLRKEIEKRRQESEKLREENANLQKQIETAQSERRDALGKLDAVSLAHEQSVSKYVANNGDSDSGRISELQSVISSMTEYLNAKEMQIDTLKQVNGQLMNELNSNNGPAKS